MVAVLLAGARATVPHLVVLHLLDLREERLDRREERRERRAGPEPALVTFKRVPLDANHEMLRLLHASGDLIANAMRIFGEHPACTTVSVLESFGVSLGNVVTNVLNYHRASFQVKCNTILYGIAMGVGASSPKADDTGLDDSSPRAGRRGRARDPAIDARILAVAHYHLSTLGYEAMSLAAVAEEARTTRQALYRRWPSKASLATAALKAAEDAGPEVSSQNPLRDLAAELADFQRGVSRPGRLSLVGTMLQDSTDPSLRARYQQQVIAPRRKRIRNILEHAQRLGLIDPDADLDVAVTLPTGSWYARALAGQPPPCNWPERTAKLIWRAVGGTISGE